MACLLLLLPNNGFLPYYRYFLVRAFVAGTLSLWLSTAWANPQITLAGLFVNGEETQTIDTIVDNGNYYLPFNLLVKQLGITPTQTATSWDFHLPIGNASIEKSALLVHENISYLPLSAVKPLGVTAKYNSQLLAIQLYVPWDYQQPFPNKKTVKDKVKRTGDIDYFPKRIGLNNVSLAGNLSYQQQKQTQAQTKHHSINKGINAGMTGYAANGIWGAQLEYQQNNTHQSGIFSTSHTSKHTQPARFHNLYWTRSGKKHAVRVGTTGGGFGVANDYTGLTLGYSSKNIVPHLSGYSSNTSRLLGSNYQDLRNIRGRGPAGGVAELRVNGRAVARVRIALDERYEFLGLNLAQANTDNYADNYAVEVAIYEYSLAEPPLRIDKPLLAKRQANVATHEWLLEAGVGKLGNHVNQHLHTEKNSLNQLHGYFEYGLTNNTAVRGAFARTQAATTHHTNHKKTYETTGMLGYNLGFSPKLNWDAQYNFTPQTHSYDSMLQLNTKKVDASYNFKKTHYHSKAKHTKSRANNSLAHHANISLRPQQWLNMQFSTGHIQQKNKKTEKYLTASAYAKVNDSVTMTVNKDRHNDYNYTVNWDLPKKQTQLSFSGDKQQYALYAKKQLMPSLYVGGSIRHQKSQQANDYYVFSDYQLANKHKLHVGYHVFQQAHQKKQGYELNWHYQPDNYTSVSMGYRHNQDVLAAFDQNNQLASGTDIYHDYMFLRFHINLFNHPTQGLVRGFQQSSRYGTIMTNIQTDSANDDIYFADTIQLKLDDKLVNAYKVAGNQYMINNVPAGVYRLGFTDDNLPIEYQENQLPQPLVKVAKAATTVVPYQLTKTLGLSGQLSTEVAGVSIGFYQKDKLVKTVQSKAFGFYQVLGLPLGSYTVKAAGYQPKGIQLTDKFLFEVDLYPENHFSEKPLLPEELPAAEELPTAQPLEKHSQHIHHPQGEE